MANVRNHYAQVTRAGKIALERSSREAKKHPGADEEERLLKKFRSRAREDFKTLPRKA